MVGYLEPEMVPSFKEAKGTLTPEPSQVQTRKKAARVVESDEDVNMEETDATMVASTQSSRKGKGVLRPVVEISLQRSRLVPQKKVVGTPSAGSKRDLPLLPNKEEGSSKRSHRSGRDSASKSLGSVVEETAGGLDLSGLVFDEDVRVNPELVPVVKGRVSRILRLQQCFLTYP